MDNPANITLLHQVTTMLARMYSEADLASLGEVLQVARQRLMEIGPSVWAVVSPLVQFNWSMLGNVLGGTLLTVKALVDLALELAVFFTVLITLLLSKSQESQIVGVVVRMLVADASHRRELRIGITGSIRRVLRFTFKVPLVHATFTWFSYCLFGASAGLGPCVWAIASALVAILAVLPVWLLALPGALELWLTVGPLTAITFLLLHVLLTMHLDPMMLREEDPHLPDSKPLQIHPYVIGLSVYGGAYFIGDITGVFLGPLAVSALLLMTSEIRQYFSDD